jgi:hypothetical protein
MSQTAALREQIIRNLPTDAEKAWFECLYSGRIPARSLDKTGSVALQIPTFIEWAHDRGWKLNEQTVGNLLSVSPNTLRRSMDFLTERKNKGPRYKVIPSLTVCRRLWDERRAEYPWPQTSSQGELQEEQWEIIADQHGPDHF